MGTVNHLAGSWFRQRVARHATPCSLAIDWLSNSITEDEKQAYIENVSTLDLAPTLTEFLNQLAHPTTAASYVTLVDAVQCLSSRAGPWPDELTKQLKGCGVLPALLIDKGENLLGFVLSKLGLRPPEDNTNSAFELMNHLLGNVAIQRFFSLNKAIDELRNRVNAPDLQLEPADLAILKIFPNADDSGSRMSYQEFAWRRLIGLTIEHRWTINGGLQSLYRDSIRNQVNLANQLLTFFSLTPRLPERSEAEGSCLLSHTATFPEKRLTHLFEKCPTLFLERQLPYFRALLREAGFADGAENSFIRHLKPYSNAVDKKHYFECTQLALRDLASETGNVSISNLSPEALQRITRHATVRYRSQRFFEKEIDKLLRNPNSIASEHDKVKLQVCKIALAHRVSSEEELTTLQPVGLCESPYFEEVLHELQVEIAYEQLNKQFQGF